MKIAATLLLKWTATYTTTTSTYDILHITNHIFSHFKAGYITLMTLNRWKFMASHAIRRFWHTRRQTVHRLVCASLERATLCDLHNWMLRNICSCHTMTWSKQGHPLMVLMTNNVFKGESTYHLTGLNSGSSPWLRIKRASCVLAAFRQQHNIHMNCMVSRSHRWISLDLGFRYSNE